MSDREGIGESARIRVWATNAFQAILKPLVPRFEREHGVRLEVSYGSSAVIMARVADGRSADAAIATREALDQLAQRGMVDGGSVRDLASTGVGVAIRAGAARPDLGSSHAVRRTLLAAPSVAYSATGASAAYFQQLIERLGIAQEVRAKAIVYTGGLVGEVVARGEAALGVQMVSEILAVPGVDLAGPLPADIQCTTLFAGGVFMKTAHADVARALVGFLADSDVAATYRAAGMEPGVRQ